VTRRPDPAERPGPVPAPEPRPPAEPAPAPRRVRTSGLAVFGLLFGAAACFAALTGRLAPVALLLAVAGVVLAIAGLSATTRPNVTGRGVGALALLLSAGGFALALAVMLGVTPWPRRDVDEISMVRDWLNAQLPWLKRI